MVYPFYGGRKSLIFIQKIIECILYFINPMELLYMKILCRYEYNNKVIYVFGNIFFSNHNRYVEDNILPAN